jgi:hypothetical protein
MALEALQASKTLKFTHLPRHDLESLFYVVLAVCGYTIGPCTLRSHIPEDDKESVPMNEWWFTNDRHNLARTKAVQISSFKKCILDRLPPYWDDFHPVLYDLRAAIWEEPRLIVLDQNNVATHDKFLSILRKARDRYLRSEEKPANFACLSAKDKGAGTDAESSLQESSKDDSPEFHGKGTEVSSKTSKSVEFALSDSVIEFSSYASYVDSGAPEVTED